MLLPNITVAVDASHIMKETNTHTLLSSDSPLITVLAAPEPFHQICSGKTQVPFLRYVHAVPMYVRTSLAIGTSRQRQASST
jgi:hypothetical protein